MFISRDGSIRDRKREEEGKREKGHKEERERA